MRTNIALGMKTQRRVLVACIAALLAGDLASARTADHRSINDPFGDTLIVTNCDDDGVGSLRATLGSATDGDVIDLTELECSTITLTSGELATTLDEIRLNGNDQIISADGNSRVFAHNGSGTLHVAGITFADGVVSGVNQAYGGCIYSSGSLALASVTVRNCSVSSTPDFTSAANGGGVFAQNAIYLTRSTIENNEIFPAGGNYSYGHGGGLFSRGNMTISASTISGNVVHGIGGAYRSGGGIYSRSDVTIRDSTISGNSAYSAGAADLSGDGISSIVNSTISGNTAVFRSGGITSSDEFLKIWNSTIAFNTASDPPGPYVDGAGVLILGHNQYLSLRSSIIAANSSGGVSDDLCLNDSNHQTLVGANNLIQASNITLPDTINSDPMLAPLADNGGSTFTHALLPGSPAINAGNNLAGLTYDQRGEGFDRIVGPAADIGAYEEQQPPPDGIFASGFE